MNKKIKLNLTLAFIATALIFFSGCDNETPEIIQVVPSSNTVIKKGQSQLIQVQVSHTDVNNLTYYWKATDQDKEITTEGKWTFTPASTGTYTIKIQVKDNEDVYSDIFELIIIVEEDNGNNDTKYPWHTGITASTFWCGEDASDDNDFITNTKSAWDIHWGEKFGLEDHPTNISRDANHIPTSSKYKKTENPYYFALPYNDFGKLVYDGKGTTVEDAPVNSHGRKTSSYEHVHWADSKSWSSSESMVKNRWIRIVRTASRDTCYAQWEDAGPYYYNDYNYVFGTSSPSNTTDYPYAGIDLSPSVCLYFHRTLYSWGAEDFTVNWQFVDEEDVPEGPWKIHVTTSQIDWD